MEFNHSRGKTFCVTNYKYILRETDNAIWFVLEDGSREWIPKSKCVVYKVSKNVEIESDFYYENVAKNTV